MLIKNTFTLNDYVKILGSPDRKTITKVTSYDFDKYGIRLYEEGNSKVCKKFNVFFVSNNNPTHGYNAFIGTYIIGDYVITKYASLESIKKIPGMHQVINDVAAFMSFYEFRYGNKRLYFAYDQAGQVIQSIQLILF